MSLNKVQLIGRLGKDPETHTFDNGGKKVSFTLATTERWKDKNTGERREKTEWHNIAIIQKGLTEVAENYLSKGKQVFVEGKITNRSYEDNKTGQKRYYTEIVVNNLVMLGGKADDNSGGNQQPQQQNVQTPQPIVTDMPEGDLPF